LSTVELFPSTQREEALKLWGEPKSFSDVAELFAQFCEKQLLALPWSDQPASSETAAIASDLAKINRLGFLTINSQPAVNGARSNDPRFGWGPSNGYVYQKVSRFFSAPLCGARE
jgi:methylenetetrahydrofolate reductase (NADPH)